MQINNTLETMQLFNNIMEGFCAKGVYIKKSDKCFKLAEFEYALWILSVEYESYNCFLPKG